MDKHQDLAADIIDLICEKIEEEYGIEPKQRKDDGGNEVENPALLFGKDYYALEDEIAQMIRNLDKNEQSKDERKAELDESEYLELKERVYTEQDYVDDFNSEPAN